MSDKTPDSPAASPVLPDWVKDIYKGADSAKQHNDKALRLRESIATAAPVAASEFG